MNAQTPPLEGVGPENGQSTHLVAFPGKHRGQNNTLQQNLTVNHNNYCLF